MPDKVTRDRIVEAADQLFFRQGFEHTSFADIAQAVSISRGNFYHHFKSKDEILDAVIDVRLSRAKQMLERWEGEHPTPLARLRTFVDAMVNNRRKIMRFGCPDGSMCIELAKLGHVAHASARALLALHRGWLGEQFALLGQRATADQLATHLLVRCQGVATLATAFGDESLVRRELEATNLWLETVAAKRR